MQADYLDATGRTTGALYDPVRNRWSSITRRPALGANHSGPAWTGAQLVAWNGGAGTTGGSADPKSARFAAKWFEFDVGWFYIRLLQAFHLAKVEYARGVAAARGAAHNLTALR